MTGTIRPSNVLGAGLVRSGRQVREVHMRAHHEPPTTSSDVKISIHLSIEVSTCPTSEKQTSQGSKLASLAKGVGRWVLNELAGEAFIHLARYALERVLAFLG